MADFTLLDNDILDAIFNYLGSCEFWSLSFVCKKLSPYAQRRLFRHLRLGSAAPVWTDLSSEQRLERQAARRLQSPLGVDGQCAALLHAFASRPDLASCVRSFTRGRYDRALQAHVYRELFRICANMEHLSIGSIAGAVAAGGAGETFPSDMLVDILASGAFKSCSMYLNTSTDLDFAPRQELSQLSVLANYRVRWDGEHTAGRHSIKADHLYFDYIGDPYGAAHDPMPSVLQSFLPPVMLSLIDCWMSAATFVQILQYCSPSLLHLVLRLKHTLEEDCKESFQEFEMVPMPCQRLETFDTDTIGILPFADWAQVHKVVLSGDGLHECHNLADRIRQGQLRHLDLVQLQQPAMTKMSNAVEAIACRDGLQHLSQCCISRSVRLDDRVVYRLTEEIDALCSELQLQQDEQSAVSQSPSRSSSSGEVWNAAEEAFAGGIDINDEHDDT